MDRKTLHADEFERILAVTTAVHEVDRDNKIGLDALMMLLWLKHQGTASPAQISSALHHTPPTTTRHAGRLLKYRLIDEVLDPADLRRSLLSVASKGSKLLLELERGVGADAADALLDFTVRLRFAIGQHNSGHPDRLLTEGRARLLLAAHLAARPVTLSDLGRRARLKQSAVSMMVKWFAEEGLLVDAEPLPAEASRDGRVRLVSLTPSGDETAREILTLMAAAPGTILAA